jgi:signal transduction histidine kinase
VAAVPEDILRYVDPATIDAAAGRLTPDERARLDALNRGLGARDSLAAVLDFVVESTRAISPCDRYSFAFVEEEGRRVVSHHTRAFYEPLRLKTGYAESLEGSSLREVLARGVPRIISDLPAYAELRPESRSTKLLVAEGVASSLTCPLLVEGRAVGLLFRSARRKRAYDDHQVALQVAITERLSQVVEKAWRIEQLAEANRAYFELLGFVTHELKSPLASMLTEANLLLDGYVGQLEPPQRERIDKLASKGKYLMGLVSDYLELARLEGGQVRLNAREGVDVVADVVEPAVEIVRTQFDEREIELSVDVPGDLPPAELDPQQMKIVLVNLLSNAAKYGRGDGAARLTIRREGGRLMGQVWNEGVGFPESERGRLFRRFSRLQTPELLKQKGTGVGLYTCWRIVQMHGGKIRAESRPGQWAEFAFEIPQPLPGNTEGDA